MGINCVIAFLIVFYVTIRVKQQLQLAQNSLDKEMVPLPHYDSELTPLPTDRDDEFV